MGDIDDRTVGGLKAPLVRAFEQGDAVPAFFRRRPDGAWRSWIDRWNSHAG